MNNRQLTGIFGGLLGLLSMIMPWISLTVGIFMSGSPPRTIEASPFDFVRTFATSSSGNTTTGNADLDQALEMISANVFVALVGAFILIVGSVAALLYPKIGGLAMITGWMISLFGLYIMNNHVHVGGADLVIGSSYGFIVGLGAALVVFYAGYAANRWLTASTQPTEPPQVPTSEIESRPESVLDLPENSKSAAGLHAGPALALGGSFLVLVAFLALAYYGSRGVRTTAPIFVIFAWTGLAGLVALVGGFVLWLRVALSLSRSRALIRARLEEERRQD